MDRPGLDARTRKTGRSGSRLFALYCLVSLLPIVVLGLVVNRSVSREIDERALSEAVSRAETIGSATVEPALGGQLGSSLTAAQRTRLAAATKALGGDARVLRLRVRTPSGTIVFDAADPEAPAKVDEDEEVQEAAEGTPHASLTRLDSDSIDGSSEAGPRAVETYLPLIDPQDQHVIGVLETYIPYQPFGAAAAESKRHLAQALVSGLLILWAVLAAVTWSVTRRLRESAAENAWLAHHDQLTGLANRHSFTQEIDDRIGRAERVLVAELDIARFREVNETVGHQNGDRFLQEVAARLESTIVPEGATARTDGMVARIGADQFGVLWPGGGIEPENLLLRAIDLALAEQIEVADIRVNAEVVVGYASSGQVVDGAAALLRAADLAVHAAKSTGVRVLRYAPELEQFDPDRLQLASELGDAIAGGQLVLHYQPKLHLLTGRVDSVEALVRWQHPRRGLLDPADFISIAESTNLIRPLTAWVVTEAATQIGAWRLMDRPIGLSVSVNISARSLAEPDLADEILARLDDARVPASSLQVEITETSVVADPQGARALLGRLHDAGVQVSLDDFGQGATSLVSLTRLPIDEIKIDRTFIVGLEAGDDEAAVVEFVITLGQRLGLRVVAEGIETDRAAQLLRQMGCEEGQGYRFCHPLPPRELERWLRRHQAQDEPDFVPEGFPGRGSEPTATRWAADASSEARLVVVDGAPPTRSGGGVGLAVAATIDPIPPELLDPALDHPRAAVAVAERPADARPRFAGEAPAQAGPEPPVVARQLDEPEPMAEVLAPVGALEGEPTFP